MSRERRQHKRHATTASIFIDGYPVGELRAADLSQGGIFVRTTRPMGLSANIRLEIVVPESSLRLEMAGEVVHSLPGLGMGIRFTEISEQVFARLDAYLKELEFDEKRRAGDTDS